MSKPLKLLIVRFSSIGDIVLTSPVLRILKNQKQAIIHYLTKDEYSSLLANNPYVDKLHLINQSVNEVREQLIDEKYDYVIDLHNNLRSQTLRFLNVPVKRYSKANFLKFIYMYLGINLFNNEHVVDRYLKAISFLGVKNDNQGLDFFITKQDEVNFDVKQKYISWCIGASREQKKLSTSQIIHIANKLNLPIVLLGGKEEVNKAEDIIRNCKGKKIYNYCGNISINQSAFLIQNSQYLLSNDTGLMHIGAALNKKVISFWGCTKPDLGFYPYIDQCNSLMLVSQISKRQCSNHGASCRYTEDGCIKKINPDDMYKRIEKFTC